MAKKCIWVHKRTASGPEIALYYFFQRLLLQLHFFECITFEYFHSAPVCPRTTMVICDSQSVYYSLMAHSGELVRFSGEKRGQHTTGRQKQALLLYEYYEYKVSEILSICIQDTKTKTTQKTVLYHTQYANILYLICD